MEKKTDARRANQLYRCRVVLCVAIPFQFILANKRICSTATVIYQQCKLSTTFTFMKIITYFNSVVIKKQFGKMLASIRFNLTGKKALEKMYDEIPTKQALSNFILPESFKIVK